MKGKKQYIVVIVIILSILILDQILKLWMVGQSEKITILGGILALNYQENTGIAFGMVKRNWLGIITTDLLVLFILVRFLIRQIENMSGMSKTAIAFILAGGFSNLIDRIIRRKVIDYIDISSLINQFPVFNLADVFIILGFILFVITVTIDLIKLRPKN